MTFIDTNTRGQGHRLPGNKRWRVAGSIIAAGAVVATSAIVFQNDDYQDNLQMIRSASVRNTNHDNSAYRDVKQSELVQANHLGPRSDYLNDPGQPEQSFPVVNGGQFRTGCEFSHFAYDDPILFPDQPGKAHLHMFFGNTDTNAYTTQETLEDAGSSTCNGQELNRSGYWAPAMLDGDGNARIPERVIIYYKGEGLANGMHPEGDASFGLPAGVWPDCCGSKLYERGMRNIAPNPDSVVEVPNSQGGTQGAVNYKCSNNFSAFQFADGINDIPNCDGDYYVNTFGAPYPATRVVLEMNIKFWNCFDPNHSPADNQGRPETDWEAWKPAGPGRGQWFFSNCSDAYGIGGPIYDHYPSFEYFVNYVVEPGEDTSDWFLSSDVDPLSVTNPNGGTRTNPGGAAHHGDAWWEWHTETNQQWLDNCVNFSYLAFTTTPTATGCGTGYLTDGGPDNNNPLPGPALQFRPQFDTPGTVDKYPLSQLFSELCLPLNPGRGFVNDESAAYCNP